MIATFSDAACLQSNVLCTHNLCSVHCALYKSIKTYFAIRLHGTTGLWLQLSILGGVIESVVQWTHRESIYTYVGKNLYLNISAIRTQKLAASPNVAEPSDHGTRDKVTSYLRCSSGVRGGFNGCIRLSRHDVANGAPRRHVSRLSGDLLTTRFSVNCTRDNEIKRTEVSLRALRRRSDVRVPCVHFLSYLVQCSLHFKPDHFENKKEHV